MQEDAWFTLSTGHGATDESAEWLAGVDAEQNADQLPDFGREVSWNPAGRFAAPCGLAGGAASKPPENAPGFSREAVDDAEADSRMLLEQSDAARQQRQEYMSHVGGRPAVVGCAVPRPAEPVAVAAPGPAGSPAKDSLAAEDSQDHRFICRVFIALAQGKLRLPRGWESIIRKESDSPRGWDGTCLTWIDTEKVIRCRRRWQTDSTAKMPDLLKAAKKVYGRYLLHAALLIQWDRTRVSVNQPAPKHQTRRNAGKNRLTKSCLEPRPKSCPFKSYVVKPLEKECHFERKDNVQDKCKEEFAVWQLEEQHGLPAPLGDHYVQLLTKHLSVLSWEQKEAVEPKNLPEQATSSMKTATAQAVPVSQAIVGRPVSDLRPTELPMTRSEPEPEQEQLMDLSSARGKHRGGRWAS